MYGLLKLTMSKYITYRDGDEGEPEYYILQRDFPHYVARLSETISGNEFYSEKIDGYNLHLVFYGVINGRFIPSFQNAMSDIIEIVRDMSLFYLSQRISKNPKRYKKFKDADSPNK